LAVLRRDQFTNDAQLMRGEAIISRQHHGLQPEFAGSIFPLYVDMSGFVTVEAVKE